MESDLGTALGATEEPSAQRLTLYIPDKNRDGGMITDHEGWVKKAQAILTGIGNGATAFPTVDGTWRRPDGSDLWEHTRIIYTYVDPDRLLATLPQLRAFLHSFGRETNQGKVVFEFDGWLWGITTYDQPEES